MPSLLPGANGRKVIQMKPPFLYSQNVACGQGAGTLASKESVFEAGFQKRLLRKWQLIYQCYLLQIFWCESQWGMNALGICVRFTSKTYICHQGPKKTLPLEWMVVTRGPSPLRATSVLTKAELHQLVRDSANLR